MPTPATLPPVATQLPPKSMSIEVHGYKADGTFDETTQQAIDAAIKGGMTAYMVDIMPNTPSPSPTPTPATPQSSGVPASSATGADGADNDQLKFEKAVMAHLKPDSNGNIKTTDLYNALKSSSNGKSSPSEADLKALFGDNPSMGQVGKVLGESGIYQQADGSVVINNANGHATALAGPVAASPTTTPTTPATKPFNPDDKTIGNVLPAGVNPQTDPIPVASYEQAKAYLDDPNNQAFKNYLTSNPDKVNDIADRKVAAFYPQIGVAMYLKDHLNDADGKAKGLLTPTTTVPAARSDGNPEIPAPDDKGILPTPNKVLHYFWTQDIYDHSGGHESINKDKLKAFEKSKADGGLATNQEQIDFAKWYADPANASQARTLDAQFTQISDSPDGGEPLTGTALTSLPAATVGAPATAGPSTTTPGTTSVDDQIKYLNLIRDYPGGILTKADATAVAGGTALNGKPVTPETMAAAKWLTTDPGASTLLSLTGNGTKTGWSQSDLDTRILGLEKQAVDAKATDAAARHVGPTPTFTSYEALSVLNDNKFLFNDNGGLGDGADLADLNRVATSADVPEEVRNAAKWVLSHPVLADIEKGDLKFSKSDWHDALNRATEAQYTNPETASAI